MNKGYVVSIGNELLSGRCVDTNAAYLCGELVKAGIPVVGIRVAGDDTGEILSALRTAGESAQVVLVTGGLGPTDDDVTRHSIADFLGCGLELREDRLVELKAFS